MTKELSILEVTEEKNVKCIFCPMKWANIADSLGHNHDEIPEEGELVEFEGQWIVIDAIGLPLRFEKGFRCGECKGRHHSIKAIKLCHLVSADHKADAQADYLAMLAESRYFENRGADEALAQDEYEARNGVIGFREAWHRESPETCPCCNS